jgi:hypothetical protein
MEGKFKWSSNVNPGFVVRWVSPSDWLAIAVPQSDKKPRLYKCVDGYKTTLVSASSALSLTSGTWYNCRVLARP